MDLKEFNHHLAQGNIDQVNLFPHLDQLKKSNYIFNMDFGLPVLPKEPGILIIRGPRQYGKSTWLEQEIYQTIKEFGKGTAYYLNGDTIPDQKSLEEEIANLITSFSNTVPVKRIFIDEITAITHWELALKRLADLGKLRDILIITTGSKATDLRRGGERLPGRKGRLARTNYLFTPVSFKEFHRVCQSALGQNTLYAYMISGGSPICCVEIASNGIIPEFVIELTRDWIEGEVAVTKRSRAALLNIMSVLFRFGGTPVGQAKLAREAGLANNTVASNYIELLNDLGCIIPSFPWDADREIKILRKPCKYHFTNLLAALAYHPEHIRSVDDFLSLSPKDQGMWYEWTIAQELLRRNAIAGFDLLMPFSFWQSQKYEIDFVQSKDHFIEVKRGTSSLLEFAWFSHQFPRKRLTVVSTSDFDSGQLKGVTLEEFLLDPNVDFG